MIKKFFTLLCLCTLCIGGAWGETASITWSAQSFANATSIDNRSYNIGDYFTVKCTKNEASTPPTYYTTGTAVRLYANKNTNNGNIITVSTTSTGVYITKVIYNGTHSKNGTTKFNYNGKPTSSDAISATYNEEDKLQTATATLCETGGSKNGQFYFTSIEVQYVVKSSKPKYTVTISNDIQNGTVTASPMLAEEGTDITLNATPSNGYTFGTWNVTDADKASISVTNNKFAMPAKDVTVSATFVELPKHTINLVQPEGATLTINGGTDAVEMYEGQQIDISYSNLQRGYQWGKWTVNGSGAKVTTATAQNTKFTMGTEDATLSAQVNKLPAYYVTFIDKGAVYATKQVYKTETFAEALNGVANPANDDTNFAGYSFKGWSTVQDAENPSFVSSTAEVQGNSALYAIYEKGGTTSWTQTTSISVGDEVVIAEIDHVAEGKIGKELSSFSTTSTVYGKGSDFETSPAGTLTFIVEEGESTGTYSFKNTQGNNYLCWTSGNSLNKQSTKDENSSWNVTTTSGRVKMANVKTATRVLAWNQDSPRFACYDNKTHGQEVSSGSKTYYYYPVFYVKSGSNEFSLEGGEVAVATMTSTGCATFSSDYALDLANLPEGLTAYQAEEVGDNSIKMTEVTTAVEANTGLFLAGTENTSYAIPVAVSGATLTDNLLVATDGSEVAAGSYVYVIARNAFSPLANATTVSKGKAYIAASVGAKGDLEVIFGEPTGIEQVNNIKSESNKMYNLQGVQVNKNYNGVVIMNGKKYLNK